jgi:F0F1-type ATP synthase membrane subunit b/b'
MLSSPYLYIWVSFLSFLVFAYKKFRKPLVNAIDHQILKIKNIFDEKSTEREKLTKALSAERERQQYLSQELQDIIDHAKLKAKNHHEAVRSQTSKIIDDKRRTFVVLCEKMEYKILNDVKTSAAQKINIGLTDHFKAMDKTASQKMFDISFDLLKK